MLTPKLLNSKTPKLLQNFLLANTYDNVSGIAGQDIPKYVYKHTKRLLFTMELLKPFLKEGIKILEIGAMPYSLTTMLIENFACDTTTMDTLDSIFPGEPYCTKKELVNIFNKQTNKNYAFTKYICNAEKDIYPFGDDSFDIVICTEVIEHLLYSPSHMFKESYRILKDGGIMLVSTVNALYFKRMEGLILNENIDDGYSQFGAYGRHNRNFTRKELIILAESTNFKVKKVIPVTLCGARYFKDGTTDAARAVSARAGFLVKKFKRLVRKLIHELIKLIVHLPLPGMKDKRHYNIFLVCEKV